MSARTTYGIAVSIAGANILAVTDVQPPTLEALGEVDDSRHADTDGIARFAPSGRREFTPCVVTANDVTGCTGIAAAITAVGVAAVAVVITYPSAAGTITFNGLVKSCVPGPNPLDGKREVVITIKPSPVRA